MTRPPDTFGTQYLRSLDKKTFVVLSLSNLREKYAIRILIKIQLFGGRVIAHSPIGFSIGAIGTAASVWCLDD
jgi:hypothetical protein